MLIAAIGALGSWMVLKMGMSWGVGVAKSNDSMN